MVVTGKISPYELVDFIYNSKDDDEITITATAKEFKKAGLNKMIVFENFQAYVEDEIITNVQFVDSDRYTAIISLENGLNIFLREGNKEWIERNFKVNERFCATLELRHAPNSENQTLYELFL